MMTSQDTLRSHLDDQRRLVAVIAQAVRRMVGPTLPDEIALPLNGMLGNAVAALAILDNAAVRTGYRPDYTCTRLIADPVPVVSPRPNQHQETP